MRNKMLLTLLLAWLFLAFPDLAAWAGESENSPGEAAPKTVEPLPADMGMFERLGTRMAQAWNSPTYDLYLPLYTWHNRLAYDQSHIDRYNENPWGAGLGRSFYDEDGDWHALYAMGFMDSYNKFEPIVGYGFIKNWSPDKERDWRFGVGFTMGLTARDNYDYIPLPLVLPMAGIEYKRLALQAVYIPGTRNNGNVLFAWLRWQLND